jgi:hypothetical protein
VIGYSFGDGHINEVVADTANLRAIKIFIVDPNGVDVADKQDPRAAIGVRSPLLSRLYKRSAGASRRPLTSTFNDDRVEI